ncbi:MAG: hypothetical protein AAGI23_13305 [Bacteroidota bacterium]
MVKRNRLVEKVLQRNYWHIIAAKEARHIKKTQQNKKKSMEQEQFGDLP